MSARAGSNADPSDVYLDVTPARHDDGSYLLANNANIGEEIGEEGTGKTSEVLKKNSHVFEDKSVSMVPPSTIIDETEKND